MKAHGIEKLIADSAKLDVIDHNIHDRTKLHTYNRIVPYYVMSYMKEGGSVVRHREREYDVADGQMIIIPPYTRHDHHMGASRRTVFLWWHFRLTIGRDLDVLRLIREPVVFDVQRRQHFERAFLEYSDLCGREGHTLSTLILRKAKALEVMAQLLEGASVIDYINDSFADVPREFVSMLHDLIDDPQRWRHVNALAEKYSYHPTYLSNRFRHFFGVTPTRLGRNLLYEKASILIRSRDLSMGEVAEMLGFSESSSFTRFFKSMEGVSPSELRKHDLSVTSRE